MSTSDSKSWFGKSFKWHLNFIEWLLIISLTKDTVLTDYISFIHLNFLSKICAESGFKGLAYCGGPEIICKELKKTSILPCVEYSTEEDFSLEVDLQPSCRLCRRTEHEDVNKLEQVSVVWPVMRVVVYIISPHRHLLNPPQHHHHVQLDLPKVRLHFTAVLWFP